MATSEKYFPDLVKEHIGEHVSNLRAKRMEEFQELIQNYHENEMNLVRLSIKDMMRNAEIVLNLAGYKASEVFSGPPRLIESKIPRLEGSDIYQVTMIWSEEDEIDEHRITVKASKGAVVVGSERANDIFAKRLNVKMDSVKTASAVLYEAYLHQMEKVDQTGSLDQKQLLSV